MNGLMMGTQLTTTSIMNFAEKVYPDSEIVSVTADNDAHRYTYADAFRRARQLANALAAEGLQQGERVGTLAWNDHRHFELYYAVASSGSVCHTINPRLFAEQVDFIINHADDKLVFVDPAFTGLLESIQESLGGVGKFIVLTDDANMPETNLRGAQSYESFIAGHADTFEWPELSEHTASSLCYTSGTTGNPKGVLYNHRSTVLHAYGAALPDSMNLSAHDAVMPIVPMFHVNAWSIPYAAAMTGAKLVFPGSKMGDGAALHTLIDREKVTCSAGVPTVWLALLAYLSETGKTVESLNRVVVGGAACPWSIMKDFADKYDVYVHHAWGMTETSPLAAFNTLKPGMEDLPPEELQKIKLKQGRPIFGVDFKIEGQDGTEQPWDGESTGEVKVRGPWVCSGYFGLDESDAHDDNGWFGTGDVACMDKNGYMQITDRTKDVIKSGGEWISSIELENAAVDHPGIAEAAVIGAPHPKWTERPLLVVVLNEGATVEKEEINAWMEDRVAKWWLPDDVVYVDELPHTATGKLSKKDLREQFKEYKFPGT